MRIRVRSQRPVLCFWSVIFLSNLGSFHAFLSPTRLTSKTSTTTSAQGEGWGLLLSQHGIRQQPPHRLIVNPRLKLFRKDDAPKSDDTKTNGKDGKSSGGGFFDFLSGFGRKNESEESKATTLPTQVSSVTKQDEVVTVVENEEVKSAATATEASSSTSTTTSAKPDEAPKEVDAAERSRQLKAQAERLRLEAERMDAELTLEKISRLERELASAQRAKERHDDENNNNTANGGTSSKSVKSSDKVEEIQREMEALRAKLRGEKPPAPTVRKASTSSLFEPAKRVIPVSTNKPGLTVKIESTGKFPIPGPFSQKNFDRILKELNESPDIVKMIMASIVELEYDNAASINATEVATRMEQLDRMDLSFSRRPLPEFTDDDIERAKQDIGFNSWYKDVLVMMESDKEDAERIVKNETELALRALAYEYFMEDKEIEFAKLAEGGSDFLQGFMDAINKTTVDRTIETLYPNCMRKEDSVEATMAEVQVLATEILPKASFVASERPERVLGGYIIRGSSRAENGDVLIAAIERELSKSPKLQEKMNVFYAKDFTLFAKADENPNIDLEAVDPDDQPPILFVTPRDVARPPRRIPLTIVSALGVATSWYLSVYPFLLNNGIMERVDEQISLADSNMAYDLSWLTGMSLPLFISFMGIQITHEIGHRLVSGLYNTSMSVPTFVPSLVTGMTSTVSTFKTPPKNRDAMFDISVAGPLAGIFASLLALTVGSQLTMVSDPSAFPALPLEILRQSALGGGVINSILGDNALGLPGGVTQAATGMTIALHPIAIAGYFGLVVNALSLLPVGTTDGGRIALSVFGRGAKLLVGNAFLVALLLVGILGSDLFLFYYAFVLGFQTGNDIPAKNEVDNISFSRTLIAIAAFAVGFLSLVPFQN